MMVKFKTTNGEKYHERLRNEFFGPLHPMLRGLILEHARWMEREWKADLIVTCVGRTAAENEMIGGRPKSAHLDFRAIDCRSRHLTVEQKGPFISRIKDIWPLPIVHAIFHTGQTGEHFHININRAYQIKV